MNKRKLQKHTLLTYINFEDEFITERKIASNISFQKSINNCVIDVRSCEGPIPHFHIYNNKYKFHCCVRLDMADYFDHNGKIPGKLNKDQIKILIDVLSKNFENSDISVFDRAVEIWNLDENNPFKINPNVLMPDYNKLNVKNDDGIVDDVPINDRIINTSKKILKKNFKIRKK